MMSRLLLIFLLCCCSINIVANQAQQKSKVSVKLTKSTLKPRPQKPSCCFIEGQLDGDVFILFLPEGIEYADLTLFENDAEIWSGTISKSDSYVLLPFLEDGCEYRIVCTLQDNSQYVGFIGL